MTRIEDQRKRHLWIPAVDILEAIIPLFRAEHFAGICCILLLDENCDSGESGGARYMPLKKTNTADIHMYFSDLDDLPDVARQSRMYLTYRLTLALMHEVYHHKVRSQKKLKRPKRALEEKRANKWAQEAVTHVFTNLYPRETHEEEWKAVQAALDQHVHGGVTPQTGHQEG